MRRNTGIAIVLAALGTVSAAPSSRGQTSAELAQTAAFAAAHQNKDGGFAAKVGQASSLGATNTGLRILRHVGGSVPDILACVIRANPAIALSIELHPRTYDLPIFDRKWLAFFPGLRPESLAAVGLHPSLGPMALPQILERFLVGHLEEHADQLDLLRSRAGEAG